CSYDLSGGRGRPDYEAGDAPLWENLSSLLTENGEVRPGLRPPHATAREPSAHPTRSVWSTPLQKGTHGLREYTRAARHEWFRHRVPAVHPESTLRATVL